MADNFDAGVTVVPPGENLPGGATPHHRFPYVRDTSLDYVLDSVRFALEQAEPGTWISLEAIAR
jgi:hypothetical protein